MILNTDNCHILISGCKHEHMWAKIEQTWENNTVKLIEITIDNHLKIDNDVIKTFSQANKKICTIGKFSLFLKKTFSFQSLY